MYVFPVIHEQTYDMLYTEELVDVVVQFRGFYSGDDVDVDLVYYKHIYSQKVLSNAVSYPPMPATQYTRNMVQIFSY